MPVRRIAAGTRKQSQEHVVEGGAGSWPVQPVGSFLTPLPIEPFFLDMKAGWEKQLHSVEGNLAHVRGWRGRYIISRSDKTPLGRQRFILGWMTLGQ
jgi:hypothetical protein